MRLTLNKIAELAHLPGANARVVEGDLRELFASIIVSHVGNDPTQSTNVRRIALQALVRGVVCAIATYDEAFLHGTSGDDRIASEASRGRYLGYTRIRHCSISKRLDDPSE